jgi:transcriptional regulator with XRE-family HTH domain
MAINERLRLLRAEKKLSQGELEKRTGLLRCYISRVECGHTVPSIETLEKFARALEVPMYQLFYEGAEPPEPSKLLTGIVGGKFWRGLCGQRRAITGSVTQVSGTNQCARPNDSDADNAETGRR